MWRFEHGGRWEDKLLTCGKVDFWETWGCFARFNLANNLLHELTTMILKYCIRCDDVMLNC
jgi:hypothetical protein